MACLFAYSPDQCYSGLLFRVLHQASQCEGRDLFRWSNSFFEFEFAALSYLYMEKNQYTCLLESLDKEWGQLGNRCLGRYTNLPGGYYTLWAMVRGLQR